ncbi:MAG: SAM-dependent methyltransferase [Bacteroidota bacterium]
MLAQEITSFIKVLNESIASQSLVRIGIMHKRDKTKELNSVTAKLIKIKEGIRLCFVYRYPTKDVTKNHIIEECGNIVKLLLLNDFYQAELYTTEFDYFLTIQKNDVVSLRKKKSVATELPNFAHDREKARIIKTQNNYLFELGITNAEGQIKTSMNDKYRQINKYIEIIDGIMKQMKPDNGLKVIDMGSGKGYLTFALYDYFINALQISPSVTGIEQREELVSVCNSIALKSNFAKLKFVQGNIQEVPIKEIDVLIALHACDTATDDAIFRGIKSNAKLIICAPCCHKQVRKDMHPNEDLSFLNQYGILKERQAEMITDAMRALYLEAYGYQTKVFEFIDTEHTPKNVMIVGIKQEAMAVPIEKYLLQIKNLMKMFGISTHYLGALLN